MSIVQYLEHYSFGKVLLPENDKSFFDYIKRILEKRNTSPKVRRRYCMYHLRHMRFNLIRKYVSLNQHNTPNLEKTFGKFLIDNILEATEWSLIYFDIWPKTKREVMSAATEKFGDKFDTLLLDKLLKIRKNWQNTKKS